MGSVFVAFILVYGVVYSVRRVPRSIFISRHEKAYLHRFYTDHFSFYNLLDPREKNRFLARVYTIRRQKELRISPEIRNRNSDVELLVCAAFAQITFGYRKYELYKFQEIIIRPDKFYSRLVDGHVKGLTLGNGYIFYSWEDFLKGYISETDKINLALHELAHALYIDRFHRRRNRAWQEWVKQAVHEMELLHNNGEAGLSFFRNYGQKSIDEFWAVNVECFFEDPVTYRAKHPELYQATANVLKQDMAVRKMQYMN